MKGAGGGLLGIGAVLIVISLLIDPGVSVSSGYGGGYGIPDRVVNLHKLQVQLMVFQGGVGSLIAGSILFAVGSLIERLAESAVIRPAINAFEQTQCGWCDQIAFDGKSTCSALTGQQLDKLGPGMVNSICREQLLARGHIRQDDWIE